MAEDALAKLIKVKQAQSGGSSETPVGIKNTPQMPSMIIQAPSSKNLQKESEKGASGFTIPLAEIKPVVDLVNQAAGSEQFTKDAKGNPIAPISRLSGFDYLTKDIMAQKELRDQLAKHMVAPRDLSGTMTALEAAGGDNTRRAYTPPENEAANLADRLERYNTNIMKGNQEFTADQIAMLGKLITPPQRIITSVQANESSSKGMINPGAKPISPRLQGKLVDINGKLKMIKGIEDAIGAPIENVQSVPGGGFVDNVSNTALNATGLNSPGIQSKVKQIYDTLSAQEKKDLGGKYDWLNNPASSLNDPVRAVEFLRLMKANNAEKMRQYEIMNPYNAYQMGQ